MCKNGLIVKKVKFFTKMGCSSSTPQRKTLLAELYEDGVVVDLRKIGKERWNALIHLSDKIASLLPTPEDPKYHFSVDWDTKDSWFKHWEDCEIYFEVSWYADDGSVELTGRRYESISDEHIANLAGKRFIIKPDDTPNRKWGNVEVVFKSKKNN